MYEKNSFLDKRINTPEIMTIKSAVPHLRPPDRRMVSMIIKFIEIRRILDYLRETADAFNKINSKTDADGAGRRQALLELIMPHLSPENQSQLQTMLTFMEVLKRNRSSARFRPNANNY
jgi:hypothetical protein